VVKGEGDFEVARSDRPSVASLIALADGARDRAEWAHARAGYRAAVAFARDDESRGSVWSRLGAMERARCDEDEAIRAYERAVAARPADRESLDALVELANEKGDVARATAWAKQRVELLESPADRVDELFALARASLTELSDMPGAIALLERARAIEPRDDVLEALRRAYKKQASWSKLVEILGELAGSAPTDAEKAARRFAQARVALDKMNDETRAVGYLTLALEEDPTHDEALDVLVEVRTSLGEHAELGRTLERLAGRLEGMGEAERALDVRVRIDGLPSSEASEVSEELPVVLVVPPPAPTPVVDLSTLDADATGPQEVAPAHPTERTLGSPDADGTGEAEIISVETGKRAAVAEKLLAEGDEGGALEELEETLNQAPLDETTHARLYGMHMQAERHDRSFLSAMALEELGILAPEREAWLEQARGAGALRVRALLDAAAWELLRGPGSDEVVESLFAAVSKAAIAAQVDDRRARRKLPSLDPARKQAKESTASIVASFKWAARVLGVECPDLYVFEDVPGDVAAVPAQEPVAVLGPQVLSGRSTKELAFIVGKHLTYYRPEYAVLLYYPTIQDLTLLVLAAVQLAMPAMPVPPSVATQVESLRTRLAAHLGDAARAAMVAAVHRLDARGGRMDLGAWVKSVEATATRVGLVLSGDLKSTMARVREESRATSCVTLEEARADLVRFCVSRAHADIRADYALVTSRWPPAQTSVVRSREDYATPVWNLAGDRAM
jgi:tetratricopeptide (TPR) repeat protein